MKKNLLLLVFALITAPALIFGQQNMHVCGTEFTPEMEARLKMNIKDSKLNSYKSGGTTYIPTTIHLVANSQGQGRVEDWEAWQMFCEINDLWASNNIQFYLFDGGFNYIDNDQVYNTPYNTPFVIFQNKVDGTMNLFIANNATAPGTPSTQITLGFYDPQTDIVIFDKDFIENTFVVAHEIGHFFSLPHTFNGWETTQWTAGPAPNSVFWAGSGTVLVENVARTGADANCDNAGDFFCDTPADYRFGLGWPENCNFNATALDPLGVQVDPQEDNFMGYFFGCPDYSFSQQQTNTIFADIANRNLSSATIDPVLNPVTQTFPGDGQTLLLQNVSLEWNVDPNATAYLLEVNRNISFTQNQIVYKDVVTNTTITLGALLQNNNTYYWRVRPLNNASCASWSVRSFNTGTPTSVNEIPGVSGFLAYPNPLNAGNQLQIELSIEKQTEVDLGLYDVNGKLLRAEAHTFQSGFNTYNFPVGNVPNGVYLLSVQSKQGVLHQKIVVAK